MMTPLEFVGYTFCFWAVWKGYDWAIQFVKNGWSNTSKPVCHDCEKIATANNLLVRENMELQEKVKEQEKKEQEQKQKQRRAKEAPYNQTNGNIIAKFEADKPTTPKEQTIALSPKEQATKTMQEVTANANRRITIWDIRRAKQKAIENINRASKAELMAIKGIGPAHARRIQNNRPFDDESDIRRVLPGPLVNKLLDHFGSETTTG